VELEQTHSFAIDEARERVRALADYLHNKHGMAVQWSDPDTLTLRGKYTVVTIDTEVRVEPTRVRVTGKDPGLLWRVPAKKYVSNKLEHYLSAAQAVGNLPRR
jgi:Putative polyhydroxyalkanoic acid system protein (PHA_gran_rgn)